MNVVEEKSLLFGKYSVTQPVIGSAISFPNLEAIGTSGVSTPNISIAGLAGVRFDLIDEESNPKVLISIADIASKNVVVAGTILREVLNYEVPSLDDESTLEEKMRAQILEMIDRTRAGFSITENLPTDIRISIARGVLALVEDKPQFVAAGIGTANFFRGYYDDERRRWAMQSLLKYPFLREKNVGQASFLRPNIASPQIVSAVFDLSQYPETLIFAGNDTLRKITQLQVLSGEDRNRKERAQQNKGKFDPTCDDERNFFMIDLMENYKMLSLADRAETLVTYFIRLVDIFNNRPSQRVRGGEDAAIGVLGCNLIPNSDALTSM